MYLRFAFEDGAETFEYMALSMRRNGSEASNRDAIRVMATLAVDIPVFP